MNCVYNTEVKQYSYQVTANTATFDVQLMIAQSHLTSIAFF